jgi:hypothetical protein
VTSLELVRSLRSETCPMCGGRKQSGQTMCQRDYCRLPRGVQSALYRGLGRGYEQAIQSAMGHLSVTNFIMPKVGV